MANPPRKVSLIVIFGNQSTRFLTGTVDEMFPVAVQELIEGAEVKVHPYDDDVLGPTLVLSMVDGWDKVYSDIEDTSKFSPEITNENIEQWVDKVFANIFNTEHVVYDAMFGVEICDAYQYEVFEAMKKRVGVSGN